MQAYVLSRVRTNGVHSNLPLRTNMITGVFDETPIVGKPFIFMAKPLTEGATVRVIMTGPVTEILENGFKTINSTYSLVPNES